MLIWLLPSSWLFNTHPLFHSSQQLPEVFSDISINQEGKVGLKQLLWSQM